LNCRSAHTTEDHIFSEFLGGRKTIPACRHCNNGFGLSFEGGYSQALLKVKTWLAVQGVPLKWDRDFRWKGALEYQGKPSDLVVRDGEILLQLSNPELVRDGNGAPVELRARNMAEADKVTAGLKRKHNITKSEARIETATVSLGKLRFRIDAGPDLGLLALKMCSGAATLLPGFEPADIETAVSVLRQATPRMDGVVAKDDRAFQEIESVRPAFAHVIFVERTRHGTVGIVQFFGWLQLHCTLGRHVNAPECGLLCLLDTASGRETFEQMRPLSVSQPPAAFADLRSSWCRRMIAQAQSIGLTGFDDMDLGFGNQSS
jgi:hypothetical protein